MTLFTNQRILDFIVVSSGVADAGKKICLDAAGLIDPSMIPGGGTPNDYINFISSALDGAVPPRIDWSKNIDTSTGSAWPVAPGGAITVPAGAAGNYQVVLSATPTSIAEWQICLEVQVNATTVALFDGQATAGGLGAPYKITLTGNAGIGLSVGDVIEVNWVIFSGAPTLYAPAFGSGASLSLVKFPA